MRAISSIRFASLSSLPCIDRHLQAFRIHRISHSILIAPYN